MILPNQLGRYSCLCRQPTVFTVLAQSHRVYDWLWNAGQTNNALIWEWLMYVVILKRVKSKLGWRVKKVSLYKPRPPRAVIRPSRRVCDTLTGYKPYKRLCLFTTETKRHDYRPNLKSLNNYSHFTRPLNPPGSGSAWVACCKLCIALCYCALCFMVLISWVFTVGHKEMCFSTNDF